jgi:hypothetical protein
MTNQTSGSTGSEAIDIGTQRQLFLDDHIVERLEWLERIPHQVKKRSDPVLVADQPWEMPGFLGVLGNCVFRDPGDNKLRMYYQAYKLNDDGSETLRLALATSMDGVKWVKPALGIAESKGSRDNNLLSSGSDPRRQDDWWCYSNVIRDDRDPDPSRRYKALGHGIYDRRGKSRIGVIVAFSSDGLHWTEPPENPVLPNSDTHTLLGWDEATGQYVAYPRISSPKGFISEARHDPARGDFVSRFRGSLVRCIGYSVSKDFLHWSEAVPALAPGPEDPQGYEIYHMPVFKYEGLYIGLPISFIRREGSFGPLETQLAVSRNGRDWRKVAGGAPLIPMGSPGAFDDCYAISATPVVVGDELLFYYMGCGFPHDSPYERETKIEGSIGLGRLRLDGFVSLGSRFSSSGEMLTKPIRFAGKRMVVNCDCPRGVLKVELQSSGGEALAGFSESECDPISADAVRKVVTWQGRDDVSSLAGQAVRVRIRLSDGEIYSFGFAQQ